MIDKIETVVLLHAHPDDEAIFTGGTMRRLALAGCRTVLVVATGGELGGSGDRDLAATRRGETERAAAILGVGALHWLGYRDSGMAGDPANVADGAFASADLGTVADEVACIVEAEGAGALVAYDGFGIYGHPDHVRVHEAGVAAARIVGLPTWYEATVDREYLHFVETHLVEEAILTSDLGLARSHLGRATVEITTTVDVAGVLDDKRAAMAAHASQIPETTTALQFGDEHFAAVYGFEWFVRHGAPGVIDELAE